MTAYLLASMIFVVVAVGSLVLVAAGRRSR